jgi:hypothetical protein
MDKQYHEDLTRSIEALCFCLSTRYASGYHWFMLLLICAAMVVLIGLAVALGAILLAVLIG